MPVRLYTNHDPSKPICSAVFGTPMVRNTRNGVIAELGQVHGVFGLHHNNSYTKYVTMLCLREVKPPRTH